MEHCNPAHNPPPSPACPLSPLQSTPPPITGKNRCVSYSQVTLSIWIQGRDDLMRSKVGTVERKKWKKRMKEKGSREEAVETRKKKREMHAREDNDGEMKR